VPHARGALSAPRRVLVRRASRRRDRDRGAASRAMAGPRAAPAAWRAFRPRPADHAARHEGGRRSLRRVALMATPAARLASEDFGPALGRKPVFGQWLLRTIVGWGAFLGFLLFMSWLFLALTRAIIWVGDQIPVDWGLSRALGTILCLILILVMITATLLTMADRKWSALMQDRVGPNRARLSIIPGLRNMPLKGIPHILADVLKMLFKEDFIPEGAVANKWIFNLAPLLAFAPAFMLFAVVPVSPELSFWGTRMQLQVAKLDWGMLYVFALASLAVFGTALAGWSSNNKLALLGGLRASAQLVSYEVTL